MLIRTFWW